MPPARPLLPAPATGNNEFNWGGPILVINKICMLDGSSHMQLNMGIHFCKKAAL